jgi:hypothetical protein
MLSDTRPLPAEPDDERCPRCGRTLRRWRQRRVWLREAVYGDEGICGDCAAKEDQ